MNILVAHLRLSDNIYGPARDRCPDIVFTLNGDAITAIRTDCEMPQLPIANGACDHIEIWDDAISRTIDEETWMAEMARLLNNDGTLRFTLPKAGRLAWLDAMNMYRYAVDIGKRGTQPNAARPTGWNRHYDREEIKRLCAWVGLEAGLIEPANYAVDEIRTMTGLMVSNWLRNDDHTEHQLFAQFGSRAPDARRSKIGTTWVVTCRLRKP